MLPVKQNLYLNYAVLFVLIYFVVFAKLGDFPFRFWDESMFAVNAYEMEKNGNYMVPYFDGAIDWRNSKPLLLTWIQTGFIKVFGFGELTMRLPSAIAVALSILVLFQFLRKNVDLLFAWIAALILLTSTGYIGVHTGRTGDADALFSLFVLLSIISCANWLLTEKGMYIFLTCIFLSLSFLTKSFAGFIFIPGFALAGIYFQKKAIAKIFKTWHFYAGTIVIMLVLIFIFYVRDLYQPGYLASTFQNDAGRFFNDADNHTQGWDFYLQHIFYERYLFWTIPFFFGLILIQKISEKSQKILAVFATILTFSYLIIISVSTTKLYWYDMPIYPLMACISAIPICLILNYSVEKSKQIRLIIVMIALFFIPYRKMFFDSQSQKMPYGDRVTEMTSLYLHHQIKHNQQENLTVFHHGYAGSLLCYKYMYADRGKELTIKYAADFHNGEVVFVSNENLKKEIYSIYNLDTISVFETGIFVRINCAK